MTTLTARQAAVLNIVQNDGKVDIPSIAARLNLKQSEVRRVLDALAKKAPASAEAEETEVVSENKESNMGRNTTEVEYTHPKSFWPSLAAGAAELTNEETGITVTADREISKVVIEGGNKTQRAEIAQIVEAVWASAWEAFKEWKKDPEVKAARKEQYKLGSAGVTQMLKDENEFFWARWGEASVL